MAVLDYLPERVHPAIYAGIALVTFLVVLAWRAPAALIPHFAPQGGPVTLERATGTLWQGRAELKPVGVVRWSMNLLPLAWLKADIDWMLEGNGLLVAGNLSTRGGDVDVGRVKGQVSPSAVNPFLARYGISVEGDLRLSEIEARLQGNAFTHASGLLAWTGGTVNYQLGGKSFTIDMPPLSAVLRMQDDAPTLDVSMPGSGETVMQITLNSEGWAELKMTKRFLEVAGFPWQGKSTETYVLVVSEKLF